MSPLEFRADRWAKGWPSEGLRDEILDVLRAQLG